MLETCFANDLRANFEGYSQLQTSSVNVLNNEFDVWDLNSGALLKLDGQKRVLKAQRGLELLDKDQFNAEFSKLQWPQRTKMMEDEAESYWVLEEFWMKNLLHFISSVVEQIRNNEI